MINLVFALVLLLGNLVPQPQPIARWVDWIVPTGTTSTVRTYQIYGGTFNLVIEGERNFSQDKARAVLSGTGYRVGTINYVPLAPCWAITIRSDDRSLERVWLAPDCNRVFMPMIGY
jgi:hypothetical protein